MTDRRRINGPSSGTIVPTFISSTSSSQRPNRTRQPDELRKIFLKTGVTPSAPGSAYLELSPSSTSSAPTLVPTSSNLKITCTVHGPRPLPRSVPFSPQLVLSTNVKFAPFATRKRRGYVRDSTERDLGQHLESALRGVIIGERWSKSGVDVVITILEGEESCWWGDEGGLVGADGRAGSANGSCGLMSVLAGCITVASAALVNAGIDCVGLVSGGVAAMVNNSLSSAEKRALGSASESSSVCVLDPSPPEHDGILRACVVAYIEARDEITEIWLKGEAGSPEETEQLTEKAVVAALASGVVLKAAVSGPTDEETFSEDVDMS
ncbi:hypothetical protein K402DRAFT_350980 [Aulographum hederae CBS 113979]|uniref:Exoribonuclease phosphorolytic domain-containing protein n=1 Tax=Aulographum hederae CBS 113979 TaxID=1176131 RepID=A0A6G1H7M6_9PEZI|nr:hypothetical protein K402DRAFT_350980 [Aulographum hederae CBS 113979]